MNLKNFAFLCIKAENECLLDEWLQFLFTPAELEDLSKRLDLVVALLKNEETQREIAKNQQISIAKITRGSNALKTITPEFKQFLIKYFGEQ